MTDSQLVEKALKDKEQFRLIVKKYQGIVLNYLYGLVWEKHVVEDLTQEAFLSLYQNLVKYNKKKSLKSWLLTIARNKAIDYFRSKKKTEGEVPLEGDAAEIDDSAGIEDEEGLKQMLNRLKQMYKEVLLMYYWQEFSYKEIAGILKISINTVKTRIRRAKDKLKIVLKKQEYERFI